jgi:signal peptidase
MKKVFSKIFSLLLYIIIFSLIAVIGISVYYSSQNKVPSIFGYSVLRIVSNSMADEFVAGDFIIIKKEKKENLKNGDIISFYSLDPSLNGSANTHRIVELSKDSFVTKGDANSKNDEYKVEYNKVIGKYQGKLNGLFFTKIFTNKILFFLIVVLPIVAIMIFEIIRVLKIKAKENK